MANQVPLSPGVYTSERELTANNASIGATTLGTVGETTQGPAFEPVFVTSYDTYKTYFGGLNKTTFPGTNIPQYEQSYVAKTFLSESNSYYATRVLGYSGYDAGTAWNITLSYVPNYDNVYRSFGGTTNGTYNEVSYNDLGAYGIPGLNSVGQVTTSTTPSIYVAPSTGQPGLYSGGTWGYNADGDGGSAINGTQYVNAGGGSSFGANFQSAIELAVVFSSTTKGGAGKLVVTGSTGANPFAQNGLPWASELTTTAYPLCLLSGETLVISTNSSAGGTNPVVNNTGFETTRVAEQINGTTYNTIRWNPAISRQDNGTNFSNITPSNTFNAGTGARVMNPLGYPCTGYTYQLNWRYGNSIGAHSGGTQGWTAQTSGTVFTWTAATQDMVVAKLRSRGNYELNTFSRNVGDSTGGSAGVTTQQSPSFGDGAGPCPQLASAPLSPNCTTREFRTINTTNYKQNFYISGFTGPGAQFSNQTNLDPTSQNYITKVFGTDPFDKTNNIWVEEIYANSLNNLATSAVTFSQISIGQEPAYDNYSEDWQPLAAPKGPETPFIMSEIRGNKIFKLFKVILIPDGNNANDMVKISIQNINKNTKTFTLVVRDINDTDSNQIIYESYQNCTLNPGSQNYVGIKIGTENGDYPLRSRYIMLSFDEDAPINALPAGFQGYPIRNYSGATFSNEVYQNPPAASELNNNTFNSGVVSGWPDSAAPKPFYNLVYDTLTDNIQRTYLGWSSKKGFDKSFFIYKGLNGTNPTVPYLCGSGGGNPGSIWTGKTLGFHFDNRVSAMTVTDTYQYNVGAYNFNASGNTSLQTQNYYNDSNYLKFTVIPYGGNDGWDRYRKSRTNGDTYILNQTNYATFWYNNTITSSCLVTDYYPFYDGIRKYSNPEDINISLFGTPGIDYTNNLTLVNRAIEMIENDRADSLYVVNSANPTNQTTDSAVDNFSNSALASSYVATYWPWVRYKDTENNIRLYLPPTGEVLRSMALTDNISFPWFAPAGQTRGMLSTIDKAQTKLTQQNRDDLYEARINPIATFNGVGVVIWGQKTLQNTISALDRINVRRLMIYLKKKVTNIAVQLLFEQNDDIVRQQFLSLINPILEDVRRDRGLIEFKVQLNSDVSELDTNSMTGKIFVKPTKTLEFIEVEFNITPSSVSFNDITQ
jgi:hypothetical protein|tara:strand:+ start:1361 stop:4831 length:3471 start_codon:yes stop_codon:yes gene_type:complete